MCILTDVSSRLHKLSTAQYQIRHLPRLDMRSFLLTVLTAAAISVFAIASPLENAHNRAAISKPNAHADLVTRNATRDSGRQCCLNAARAQQVATNFRTLIVNYTEAAANATFTTDYTDYSGSVNELIDNGCPNGPILVRSLCAATMHHAHLTSLLTLLSLRVLSSRVHSPDSPAFHSSS